MGYKYTSKLTKQTKKNNHALRNLMTDDLKKSSTYKTLNKLIRSLRRVYTSQEDTYILSRVFRPTIQIQPLRQNSKENRELFILEMDKMIGINMGMGQREQLWKKCINLVGREQFGNRQQQDYRMRLMRNILQANQEELVADTHLNTRLRWGQQVITRRELNLDSQPEQMPFFNLFEDEAEQF